MRLLLDTCALLWWLAGSSQLSAAAYRAIADEENEIFVSAASAWEIATKYRLGKLPGAATVAADIAGCIASQGFRELPVTVRDGQNAGQLEGPHRDPFDRMLIAQALDRGFTLVTNGELFGQYGVRRIW